jgi:hypothetical protein
MVDIIEIESDSYCSVTLLSPDVSSKPDHRLEFQSHSAENNDDYGQESSMKVDHCCELRQENSALSYHRDLQTFNTCVAVTDGDAIISKYGTENIGIEQGVSFSYAFKSYFPPVISK